MLLFFAAALVTSIPPVQAEQPNRQPQLASVPGLSALVFASGNSIWFSASRGDGITFASATQVTNVPVLAVGRHRGPRLTIAVKTIVITAVSGNTLAAGPHAHGLPSDGDLLAWRSVDGGRSWSKPIVINDVPGSAREGLHAIAAGVSGELAAVWLDLRGTGTRLYGAYSTNSGASWSKNVLLYESPNGTICQCCDPSVVFIGHHRAEVMFRNVIEGCRDMHLLSWQLNGAISEPKRLGGGSWRIDACPMDGGGLAYREGNLFTAWRRDETVYLDQPGKAEIPLGKGKDISLAVTREGPDVVWKGISGIELWKSGATNPFTLSTTGSFPTLIALPDGAALAAWEDNGNVAIAQVP